MSESPHHDGEELGLRTEPSFCIYNDDAKFGENEERIKEKLERSATIGENIEEEFSFGKNGMRMIKEDEAEAEDEETDYDDGERASNRFTELKIEIEGRAAENGGGGGGSEPSNSYDHDKYYNDLRNYARSLESKGDFSGAEEHYFRAMQADPKDGEMLSEYAKLVWKLHGDRSKASHYFEKAATATPQNSDVLAAYASFLWEIDENEEEEQRLSDTQVDENPAVLDLSTADLKEETRPSSPTLHLAMGLGMDNTGFDGFNDAVDNTNTHSDESVSVGEYYRRMVEENPCNPLFLRNYALFLHQEKGDLQGAEEFYSRAIFEDPYNGEMLSLYAGILWQLHHDKDNAVAYFKRAVKATPRDSNVLAAYAKFLWETEAEEDARDEAQTTSN